MKVGSSPGFDSMWMSEVFVRSASAMVRLTSLTTPELSLMAAISAASGVAPTSCMAN